MRIAIGLLCLCVAGCLPGVRYTAGLSEAEQPGIDAGGGLFGWHFRTGSKWNIEDAETTVNKETKEVTFKLGSMTSDPGDTLRAEGERTQMVRDFQQDRDINNLKYNEGLRDFALELVATGAASAEKVFGAYGRARSRQTFADQGMRDPNEPEPGDAADIAALKEATAANTAAIGETQTTLGVVVEKLDQLNDVVSERLAPPVPAPEIPPPAPAPAPAPASTGNGNG